MCHLKSVCLKIISPLLSNLIQHELDKFILAKVKEYERKDDRVKKHPMSPLYRKCCIRLKQLRRKITSVERGSVEFKAIKKEIRKVLLEIRSLNSVVPNPEIGPRIKYVRYADD